MNTGGTVAIVGLGLIGGSLGLALKCYTQWRVSGYDAVAAVRQAALSRQAVDEVKDCLSEAVDNADVVIFCTPVSSIPALVSKAVPYLRPGAVVTDVASAKGCLTQVIPQLLPVGTTYIGGHPMAGTEHSGIQAARADLFIDRPYVLIGQGNRPTTALTTLQELVVGIHAKPIILDAQTHDAAVARISHLPHLLASMLANIAGAHPLAEVGLSLAAGSFQDMTRVAGSNPIMWRDICLANRAEICQALEELRQELATVQHCVETGDAANLEAFFTRAKAVREAMTNDQAVVQLTAQLRNA